MIVEIKDAGADASNVIAFPAPAAAPRPVPVVAAALSSVASSSASICSALLLAGVRDLELSVDKVASMVAAMPQGTARTHAEAELKSIRGQLETARTLSREVAETSPGSV